jgi:hypothetical protein
MARVNRPGGARCERDGDDLAALAGDDQRAVAAFGAQALDVSAGRLRNPQAVQREQGDKSVLGRRAEPGGDQQRAELVAVQPGGVRLVIDPGPADMGSRVVIQQLFLDRISVEPGDRTEPPGHRGPRPAPGFQVAREALDVRPVGIEQADMMLLAPAGVLAQVQGVRVAVRPVYPARKPANASRSALVNADSAMDQRFRLLTGRSRSALERQQTLRATVGWSYSLLAGAERVLLARLSVFADGFGLDAAEAVCGFGDLDVLDVADLLGSLVDKSLVVAEPAGAGLRYRLLETIRLFAAERLVEAGDDEAAAVAAAHWAHFLSVAEAAAGYLTGPEQGEWLARLDADLANLRRAAGYAAGRPDGTALVLRLGAALGWRYWLARSREQEALDLLVPVLRRPDAGAHPALFAAALTAAAAVACYVYVPGTAAC